MWCRLVEWIGYTWWARASVCWHLGLYVVARVGCWWSGGHVNVRRQSGSSIQVWSETLLVWRVVVSRQPPLLEPEEASQNNGWRGRIGEQQDSAGRYEEHTTPPYAGWGKGGRLVVASGRVEGCVCVAPTLGGARGR